MLRRLTQAAPFQRLTGEIHSCAHLTLVPAPEAAAPFACVRCGTTFTAEAAARVRQVAASLVEKQLEAAPDLGGRYPREVVLRSGLLVGLRPMGEADMRKVAAFARGLSPDDLLFLREDITSEVVLEQWVEQSARGTMCTLLAEDDGHLAGYACLHIEPLRWTRGIAELRVMVAERYRGRGIARVLLGESLAVAPEFSVRKLTAQMAAGQEATRMAFERMGFREEAVLRDWVTDRAGLPRDLVVMVRNLEPPNSATDSSRRRSR